MESPSAIPNGAESRPGSTTSSASGSPNTSNAPNASNDPNYNNKNSAHFRYRRSRSLQACQTCNKRKVRCDVTTKNYPEQKCTNCEEFGVECILVQRRKKRTKAQIEADRLEELKQQQSEAQVGPELTTTTTKKKRKTSVQQQKHPLGSTGPIDDPDNWTVEKHGIKMDINKVLSRVVDQFKLSQFFKVLTSHYGLKLTMHDYYRSKGTITVGHLITSQCTKILTMAGCFTLPSEEKCKKYINAYFDCFQAVYPCLSRKIFEEENKDLTNPKSLLLMRSILYIGCRAYAKTKEQHEEAALLFEQAKLILNADMEPDAVSLVLSTFILSTPPSPHLSLKTIEDGLSTTIRLAINFGMHKDVESASYLNPYEKRLYKRIFWMLMLADRAYALSFAKNYNFDASSCTVKKMTAEDFVDFDSSNRPMMVEYSQNSDRFRVLMDQVTSLQKKANVAAVKRQPVLGYHRHIDKLLKDYYEELPDYFKNPNLSINSFLSVLYYHSLNIFIQRVNMFRMLSIILKCVQSEKVKPGSSNYVTQEQFLINPCLESLSQSAFVLAEALISSVKKYEYYLPCAQNSLFLAFQSAVILLPLPYHTDSEIRTKAEDYLERVIPILADVNDSISWQMIDACWFILTNVAKDRNKYIRYLRRTVSATNVEELIRDSAAYPHLKKLTLSNTLPFIEPIFNLNATLLAIENESKDRHSSDNPTSNTSINEVNVRAHDLLMANHSSRAKVKESSSTSASLPIHTNTNTNTTTSENGSTSTEDLFVDIPYSSIQELLMVQIGNTKTLEAYKIDFDTDIKEHLPNLFQPNKMEDKNKINNLLFPSVSNTQPPPSASEMYPQPLPHGTTSTSTNTNIVVNGITSFNNLPFVTSHLNRLSVPNMANPQSLAQRIPQTLPPLRSPTVTGQGKPALVVPKYSYYRNQSYHPPNCN